MAILTAICLAYMLLVAGIVFVRFVRADSKLKFVKGFKKGWFALIYFAAIPLFAMAHYYNGVSVDGSLFSAVKSTMDLIVLEYDYETIALLANANLFYMITTYICFVLVAVNAGLFVFSFAIQIFKNWRTVKKATKKGVESYVFVGGTDQNFAFAKSVTAKGGRAIVLADLSKCDKESLCEQNVPYSAFGDNDDLLKKLTKLYGQFSDKKVNVVINTGDDKQNLLLAGQVTGICTSCGTEFLAEEKTGANVYVYGEKANTVVYEHLVSDTCGCIRFVNPNKIVAMDFVDKYPLTKFMTDEQVDFDTSLVKDDVKINVAFVGFGKTSQSLFDLFATASQLMTKQNGKVVAKKVAYHIYDGNDPKQNANLQHNYFRFTKQNDWHTGKEYLPMPQISVDDNFYDFGADSNEFYKSLSQNIVADKVYNYLIIACGDDLVNTNLSYRLVQKCKEWGVFDNTKLFVRIKDEKLAEQFAQGKMPNVYTFGSDKLLTDINYIVNADMEKMAKLNHLTYSAEFAGGLNQSVKAKARSEWYGMTQTQRESNVWSCLGIRTKMQLLGFDYLSANESGEEASQEFLAKYTANDQIIYRDENIDGRRLIKYCNANFVPDTVRGIFAQQEHQRWNASMIFAGVVPSDIEQIKTDKKGKRMDLRRHGNLTTFDGLVDFAKIVAGQPHYNADEESADVIRYDYRVMDNVVWLLEKAGYKIVKK